MKFLSLFAGIGGFDLGLERAGHECVGQVENDPACQRVLAERFPHVARMDDVREWQGDGDEHSNDVQADATGFGSGTSGSSPGAVRAGRAHTDAVHVDLLVAGFPCQDLSVAGKRAGLGGERSGLFWEIVRITKAIKPAWGLFENVPGLLSSNNGRDFWAVLSGLRECWPAVGYRILDSQFFGVAQRRRRVFIVCGPSERSVREVLFEPEGCGGNSAASEETGARVAGPVGGGAYGTGRATEDDPNLVVSTLNSGGNSGGFRTEPGEHLVARPLTGTMFKGHDEDTDTLVTIGTLREHVRPGSNTDLCVTHPLKAEGADGSEDGTGRGVPMVTEGNHDGVIGYRGLPRLGGVGDARGVGRQAALVRRLTPTECERLQGFPDGWTDVPGSSDSTRYRQLGNAVTVSVAEWIGRRIVEATP